jgi:hypothetical protein
MATKKQQNPPKSRYSSTTRFTVLERKVLRAWSEGAYVPYDLLERCVDKFGSDWGIEWPVPYCYESREADVVVGYILEFRLVRGICGLWRDHARDWCALMRWA